MPRSTPSRTTPFRPSHRLPRVFETGQTVPTPFGPLAVSAGAFQAGNTILGIGVRATGTGSITGFKPTLRFDLDHDSYAPASATGGTVGRTSFSSFSEQGDFTVQFEGASSWRGSTISVQAGSRSGQAATYTGTNDTVLLPGGVGSGTSYDFAFRAFAQPAAKSYQMFLDMTAIPKLYGSVDPTSVYKVFFSNKAGVGPIGDHVTVALNGLGTNNVVFDADLPLPLVDIDTDSNNDGEIAADNPGTDDGSENDVALPGKRIFLNIDDDNQNGLPDHIDSHSAYVAKAADDDFAEMRLKVAAAALGPLEGFTVRLRYPAAHIRLHATREKLGLVRDLTDDTDDGSRAAAGRLKDDWMAMEITFTPNQDANPQSYAVEVKLDNDVVFSDPNVVNGTGTSGSTKMLAAVPVGDQNIVFQNHWDSGVKFKNVRLA